MGKKSVLWYVQRAKSRKKVIEYLEWQHDDGVQTFIDIAIDIGEEIPDEVMPPKMPKYIQKALDFYDKVKTQWVVGFGGIVGLNYQSVESVARIYEFELTPFNMAVIQEIETYILNKNRTADG